MNSADVFEQIEKMGELPSLPQTLLYIQKVAADRKSCADDLAASILNDQALTLRVLKVVNSALYQRRNHEQIRTVRRAVIVMGFEAVRKLALGVSVFDMMSKLSRSPCLAVVTRHSLVCAGFAQILAEAGGRVAPEEAFVTALVHDIGKIVLLECSPPHMDQMLADQRGGMPALEAERRHFGITHDRAGRRLAARWKLPQELQNAIGDHHDIDPLHPPRNLDPLLGVIVYGNAMSHFTCTPENQAHEQAVVHAAARALRIPASRLDGICARVTDEIAELALCIGEGMGELTDFGQLAHHEGDKTAVVEGLTEVDVARRTVAQLDLYRQVGEGVASGRDADEMLGVILDGAVEVLGFERVVLLRVDRSLSALVPYLCSGGGSADLASQLHLPLARETGALALSVSEHRSYHVPFAGSPAYGGLAGDRLLAVARCTGYAVAPVPAPDGVMAVLYGDCGEEGPDVAADQATELAGLAMQAALVMGARRTVSAV